MKRLSLLMLPLVCAGCVGRKEAPYIGRWEGEFAVQSTAMKMPLSPVSRYGMKGFVQLYLTEDRCFVHLDGEQESVDLKGHWQLLKHQIALTFNDVKIDDAGGQSLRDPNRAFIPAKALQAAFATTVALNLGSKANELSSPLIQIGSLFGKYHFEKQGLAH